MQKEFDTTCKNILSHKVILARLLKEVMSEFKHTEIDEIIRLLDENNEGAKIIGIRNEIDQNLMDLAFKVKVFKDELVDVYVNVEGQKNDVNYPIIKRGLWYCSKMINRQYDVDFKGMDYSKIKKVISIWIIVGSSREDSGNIVSYRIKPTLLEGTHIVEKENDYDLMEVIEINLRNNNNPDGIMKLLEILLLSKEKTEKKKEMLNEYGIEMDNALENEVKHMEGFGRFIQENSYQEGRIEGMVLMVKKLMLSQNKKLDEVLEMFDLSNDEIVEIKALFHNEGNI